MSLDRIVEDSLLRLEREDLDNFLYTLDLFKSCCCSRLSWTIVNLTCFPVDTIFKTVQVKAIAVSVRLRIYLCVKIYQQSPNWDGPYKVIKVIFGNSYLLETLQDEHLNRAFNGRYLKKYFPSVWQDA
jgi:hypothetical protein